MAYEFSAQDNELFDTMSKSSRRMARAGTVLALLLAAGGLAGVLLPPPHLPRGVAPAVGALTLLGALPAGWAARHLDAASKSIGLVASTEGHDVPHVADAVGRLRDAFNALAVMLLVDGVVVAAVVAMLFPRGA
jgi:hypothetical protein